MSAVTKAETIVVRLGLKPLPLEGGFYRETYRSGRGFGGEGSKAAGTAIYYLLTPETVSRLHRLPTDEVYHFYLGDRVEMLLLDEQGARQITLGNDLERGQQVQVVVPAGTWQGSVLGAGGQFALMGTTMAPGFDFSDWEGGEREVLTARYSGFRDMIARLTPS